eukprot:TRINITY_DN4724_c0_g1_i1.p1 TRINITY_DN4724_c0_g1~~TRINITY_DN4724_c0_g1_i1.p1  ORF type:complete len:565 (+),score=77.65 TRINITY_DN4724_c0_g1_i1:96-1790(+)
MTDISSPRPESRDEWELEYIKQHATEIADLVAASTGDDLDLAGRNIKSLEAAFFEQSKESMFSKRSIDLSYNNLRELPEQFSSLCSLESLNLSYNSFKGEAPLQLAGLSNLTCLKLNMSGVNSVHVLTHLQKLRVLQMGACSVNRLPANFGLQLSELRELTITQNELDSLEELAGTENLSSLLCYMNNIKSLPVSCCRSWAKLKELHLTANNLRAVPDELFLMESLEILELSSNQLFEIPNSISKCSNLRKLLASKNNIAQFPNILNDLPHIQEIDLSFNALTYIFPRDLPENERIVTWPNLEELNLCRNKIREFPACILRLADPKIGKLTLLNLDHNRLPTLPSIPDPSVLGKMDLISFKQNRFIEIPDVLVGLSRASLAAFKETIPDEVVPGLFIGSLSSARNLWALYALGISHIINASYHQSDVKIPSVFTYKCLNLQDSHNQPLFGLLPEIVEQISSIIASGGKCLVHCQAGISRSAALVLAFLMSKRQMSLDRAYELLRSCRPVASPNLHFWSELQRFEQFLSRTHNSFHDHLADVSPLPTQQGILVGEHDSYGKPKRD